MTNDNLWEGEAQKVVNASVSISERKLNSLMSGMSWVLVCLYPELREKLCSEESLLWPHSFKWESEVHFKTVLQF